jgi:hypothetical protein
MRAPQAAKKGKVQERGTSLLRSSPILPDPIADEKPTFEDLSVLSERIGDLALVEIRCSRNYRQL